MPLTEVGEGIDPRRIVIQARDIGKPLPPRKVEGFLALEGDFFQRL